MRLEFPIALAEKYFTDPETLSDALAQVSPEITMKVVNNADHSYYVVTFPRPLQAVLKRLPEFANLLAEKEVKSQIDDEPPIVDESQTVYWSPVQRMLWWRRVLTNHSQQNLTLGQALAQMSRRPDYRESDAMRELADRVDDSERVARMATLWVLDPRTNADLFVHLWQLHTHMRGASLGMAVLDFLKGFDNDTRTESSLTLLNALTADKYLIGMNTESQGELREAIDAALHACRQDATLAPSLRRSVQAALEEALRLMQRRDWLNVDRVTALHAEVIQLREDLATGAHQEETMRKLTTVSLLFGFWKEALAAGSVLFGPSGPTFLERFTKVYLPGTAIEQQQDMRALPPGSFRLLNAGAILEANKLPDQLSPTLPDATRTP